MVASSPQTDDSVDLREYVAVLSRRKWLILAFTVLFTGLALAYSFTADPVYTGVNEILLQPQVSSSQLRPDQLVSLETEARVVTSATVAKDAAATLGSEVPIPTLLKQVSVEITPETLVLDVMFDAPTPKEAADGANAFAAAYLEFKQDRAIEVLDSQRAVIDAQRIPIQDELRAVNDRLDELSEDDPIYQEKLDERDVLEGRLDLLDLQYLQVPAVPEEAGTSILPATPPQRPRAPITSSTSRWVWCWGCSWVSSWPSFGTVWTTRWVIVGTSRASRPCWQPSHERRSSAAATVRCWSPRNSHEAPRRRPIEPCARP